ncbi:ARC6/PARC6 family protein [Chrysosporum ovalisporum CS-1034]|uniref:IMS domain-containing protein n=1 Tax=Umezakia ovalisporum TaxID=75695 RepID=UPI002474750A|nr:IMS domain-containing protein [Umezakia ovalisporum]MDH6073414.1 ARC6/PARC6 family protein [Umezakia ovalisporum CS-1034]
MFTLLLTKLMKKLTICWTLLTIYGCTQPALNSSSAGCLDKPPVSLAQEDVEEIKLNDKKLTTSGQVSSTKSMGYKFDANSGQKLSYATNADICLWVYTPDNQIIKTTELPKNGKYIIQVSAPQGLRTFDLEMTLSSVEVSSTPAPVTSPSNEISANTFSPQPAVATTTDTSNVTPTGSSIPKPRRTPSYTPSPSLPVSPAEPVHDISQKQALEIVQNWYAAKPQIFGPPYDTSLVEELTTRQLYNKKPNNEISKIPASNSKNTSISCQALGWIWLGSVNNTLGVFTHGEPLIPSKLQPVTITPSVVPFPGAVVIVKTPTNVRANVPQPPDFKLANRVGKPLKPGQKLIIFRVEGFLDQNSQSKNTRLWAQVGQL